jgi:hypothetical protein
MNRRHVSAAAICVVAMIGMMAPAAGAARHETRPLVLHLRVHKVTLGQDEQILADGRYVFYASLNYGLPAPKYAHSVGPLVDEQTGKRRMLSLPAGCAGDGLLGRVWLLFSCSLQGTGSWLELYGLRSGGWRTAPMPQAPCSPETEFGGYCWTYPTGAGANWIEYAELDCYHCSEFRRYENVWTGAIRADPSGSTTVPDLDLPALARRLCAPLRLPTQDDYDLPRYESFAYFGPYGVAYVAPTSSASGPWEGNYLERCGSQVWSATGALGNSHLLLINSLAGGNRLTGLFLPNGPRFMIPLPQGAADLVANSAGLVALSDRTLFIGTESLADTPTPTWEAALPTNPPGPKRHK